jgi:hypothetical protein
MVPRRKEKLMHSDGLENAIKNLSYCLPYRFTHARNSIEFPFGRVALSPCASLMSILKRYPVPGFVCPDGQPVNCVIGATS